MQKAIFGAGCFWGPEEKFSKITGIAKTEVGYCGGNKPQTTYEEVCTGQTNHAEVVKIEFDEKLVTCYWPQFFRKILFCIYAISTSKILDVSR